MFIFDAVPILFAVKIVASFYKVQYECLKRGVVGCEYIFVSHFLAYIFAKNWQIA